MKISILCPTRGRPQQMKRMAESAFDTAHDTNNLQILFYIDEDDAESEEQASKLMVKYGYPKITYFIGTRIVLSKMWNTCYDAANGEIFMHGGDDIVFRTEGWDTKVRNAFNIFDDKIAFVYGNDGIQPDTFGTHGFLHKNWVDTVGYFVPPYFVSDYNDTWLNDVAFLVGRKVHIDIMTEHMHFSAGKAEVDQTTQERLDRHTAGNPKEIYDKTGDERHRDARKLKEFIANYKK